MKKYKYFVAIDNGCTGTVSVIDTVDGTSLFFKTPSMRVSSYTKKAQYIHRVNWMVLRHSLPQSDALVIIERPLVNPRMFTATQSALRSLEATLIVIEMLGLDYEYCDSKTWQQEYLSSAVIGHDKMKDASKHVAIELYPDHRVAIEKHGDGDSLLMADYFVKKYAK